MKIGSCRFCGSALSESFCDLGMTPLSNSYLEADQLLSMERFYPLHAFVCSSCLLVQLGEFESPAEIFSDYAYFSSYSESWLRHAENFAKLATERLSLGPDSLVVEVASNDGYLLQNFVGSGIPCLGIEPAANVAEVARAKGIETVVDFFGSEMARALVAAKGTADLVVGNNVLAHVPHLNGFVSGLAALVGETGTISLEFPHLLRLMEESQFDTIYHEHFSYFSLLTLEKIFDRYGLGIFDVQELNTHGGSLRVWAAAANESRGISKAVADLRGRELAAGLNQLQAYRDFREKVSAVKRGLLRFLIDASESGRSVVAYGAAAKGNTLLNYCGVDSSLISFVVDRSPHKVGRYLPGTHLPIREVAEIDEVRPDYVLILPWNLRDEIVDQMGHITDWGGQFVVPIPAVEVVS